jgi:hypothetical protein
VDDPANAGGKTPIQTLGKALVLGNRHVGNAFHGVFPRNPRRAMGKPVIGMMVMGVIVSPSIL